MTVAINDTGIPDEDERALMDTWQQQRKREQVNALKASAAGLAPARLWEPPRLATLAEITAAIGRTGRGFVRRVNGQPRLQSGPPLTSRDHARFKGERFSAEPCEMCGNDAWVTYSHTVTVRNGPQSNPYTAQPPVEVEVTERVCVPCDHSEEVSRGEP